ncbi:hypothetical protein K7459_26585 [Pseudomonas fluorescens]|uniref:Uncharacterized protein n=1 Tax=Pseudomonas fluorescens (strain Pf0-1) TaxID=205922 RepID=Q3KE59_PSEPF|nr:MULTISPECIES: hypothetical protein [Pseudomonas]ABA73947.1 hypothetical protein Pfl01_2204 [Pseudomonas fluorescens Pf0-1]MBY9027229.1 hypothetical protein [Pseudomonas fluorescens]MBY9033100.1 hypothetical protein [Pseudomonas fluorescens]MBY9036523.1 hypothetical protein [Pseudomonas fluorescens]MBY9044873.1 hypothetical protein [Pseudomonas fluorescens]
MSHLSRQNLGPNTATFKDFEIEGLNPVDMTISLRAISAQGARVTTKLATNGLTVDLLNPDSLRMERKSQTTRILDTIIPRSYLEDAYNKNLDCILIATGIGMVFGLIKVIS